LANFFQIEKLKAFLGAAAQGKKISHFDQISHPRKRRPADTHTSDLTNILKINKYPAPVSITGVLLAQAKNGDEQFWK
jgi:hypothetical protein